MAVGKNKRLSKGGKRNTKRKVGDTLANKEWYDMVAPIQFPERMCGKTMVNRSKGTFSGPENIKGRVFEVCLADLMGSEDKDYKSRKVQMKAEDVQGRCVLLNFHGMSLTTDKLRSLLQKWCTLIEGSQEVKTSDGYTLRVFAIAFTKKRGLQNKKNCHCQTSHVKKIRTKMAEIIQHNVAKNPLDRVVKILQEDVMGSEIQKACAGIFPLRDVHIRKVKVTKAPKVDIARIVEQMHGNDIPVSHEGGRQLQTTAAPEEPAAATTAEADD
eukprot:TRINITY_DN201_c0_g1_i1.p1 TRINITY_DN201_c0_g1~~TRINITY_DN201_c0_g1_i1.p1  ORF type:complete len:286 (+),score=128.03 TRINITY_DN201_c0_g1_i1:51-860(+)